MHQEKRYSPLFWACITFAPIFFYWLFKEFIVARPFWVFFDHIETLYYYTAIEISEGKAVHNVDNPGTLVQLLGLIPLAISGSNPSGYTIFLRSAHVFVLLLSFASIYYYFIRLQYLFGNKRPWCFAIPIWIYFSFGVAQQFLQVWSPEAFYFPVGLLFLVCLLELSKTERVTNLVMVAMSGVFLGSLLSIKFLFLAWIPGYFLFLLVRYYRSGFLRLASIIGIGALSITTSFAVITSPVWERYPYMFGWLTGLILNDGVYGRGSKSLPNIEDAFTTWLGFLLSSKVWIVFVLFMMVLIVVNTLSNKSGRANEPEKIRITPLMVFVITSIIFSLLFVIRQYAQRYMLPIGLCGVLIAAVFVITLRGERPRLILSFSIFLAFAILAKAFVNEHGSHQRRIAENLDLRQKILTLIDAKASEYKLKDPVVIYSWRFSAPSFSLRQMAYYEDHQQRVDELYPKEGHFTPWPNTSRFRIPSGESKWEFAVVRKDMIKLIPSNAYRIIGSVKNYSVLMSDHVTGGN